MVSRQAVIERPAVVGIAMAKIKAGIIDNQNPRLSLEDYSLAHGSHPKLATLIFLEGINDLWFPEAERMIILREIFMLHIKAELRAPSIGYRKRDEIFEQECASSREG